MKTLTAVIIVMSIGILAFVQQAEAGAVMVGSDWSGITQLAFNTTGAWNNTNSAIKFNASDGTGDFYIDARQGDTVFFYNQVMHYPNGTAVTNWPTFVNILPRGSPNNEGGSGNVATELKLFKTVDTTVNPEWFGTRVTAVPTTYDFYASQDGAGLLYPIRFCMGGVCPFVLNTSNYAEVTAMNISSKLTIESDDPVALKIGKAGLPQMFDFDTSTGDFWLWSKIKSSSGQPVVFSPGGTDRAKIETNGTLNMMAAPIVNGSGGLFNKSIPFSLNNGSNIIATGYKTVIPVDFSGQIILSRLRSHGVGSINISYYKADYANYPTTWTWLCNAVLSSGNKLNDYTSCSGKTVAVDDNIELIVNSADVLNATAELTVQIS